MRFRLFNDEKNIRTARSHYTDALPPEFLHPFTTTVIKEILADHANSHRKICFCLYLLTGGVAKYITLLMEAKAFNKNCHDKIMRFSRRPATIFLTQKARHVNCLKDHATIFSSYLSLQKEKQHNERLIPSSIKNTGSYLANLEGQSFIESKVN